MSEHTKGALLHSSETVRGNKKSLAQFLGQHSVLIGMLLVLIVFQLINNKFFAVKNLVNVLNQSSLLIIMSIGMMMAMSVKAVDLSTAQIADGAGLLAAMLLIRRMPLWIVFLAPVAFGGIVGTISCMVISYLGVSAIIATLGQMLIIRSMELMLTNSAEAQILFTLPAKLTKNFFFLGTGKLFGIPFLIIFTVLIIIIAYMIRHKTVLGRKMDAVGGNLNAAFFAGIRVRRVFGSAFIIGAVFSAISGVALVSRTGSAVPCSVESYLMDCFVAVYLGAVLTKNNRMNVVGTAVGALFTRLIDNWITLMGLGAAYKSAVNGIIILAALSIGALRKAGTKG